MLIQLLRGPYAGKRALSLTKLWIKQHSMEKTDLQCTTELTNKGSVPYCGSNDNNSTGVSLSESLFSFMLEKYIVCDACGLRSPSFESSSVLDITPTCTSSMQELIKQGMKQKIEKSCSPCKKNTWHVESYYLLQPPKYLIIVVNRFRYINNSFTKKQMFNTHRYDCCTLSP